MATATPPPLYGSVGIPHSPSGSPNGGIVSAGGLGRGGYGGSGYGSPGMRRYLLARAGMSPLSARYPQNPYNYGTPPPPPPPAPGGGLVITKDPTNPYNPPVIGGHPYEPPQPGIGGGPTTGINNPPGWPGDTLLPGGGAIGGGGEGPRPIHPIDFGRLYPGLASQYERTNSGDPWYVRKFGRLVLDNPTQGGTSRVAAARLGVLDNFARSWRGGQGQQDIYNSQGYGDTGYTTPIKRYLRALGT